MPLLGTKTPSAPIGVKSGGDRRAARSLLSCVLWRGMGRLWRGMGGMGRPEPLSAQRPHRQQRLSGFHETRNTAFMLFTNHSFPTHDFPRFPTISHDFPAFPGPPHPPSADQVSTRRPPFLVSSPDCRAAPRCPVTAFLRAVGRLWSGYGAAWAAAVPRTGNTAFRVFTKHETRIAAFLHAREFPYNHWGAAGRSSPACPHGSRRWLDTSPHL